MKPWYTWNHIVYHCFVIVHVVGPTLKSRGYQWTETDHRLFIAYTGGAQTDTIWLRFHDDASRNKDYHVTQRIFKDGNVELRKTPWAQMEECRKNKQAKDLRSLIFEMNCHKQEISLGDIHWRNPERYYRLRNLFIFEQPTWAVEYVQASSQSALVWECLQFNQREI